MDEREFELVNIIGAQLASSQRELSERMDLSLGMTNMLIRRLITKGYIRIRQLNKKKVEYLLTPKGFSEKMRKSVKYTLKTINSIGLIKRRVAAVLDELWGAGHRRFFILGASDLAGIIEIVLREKFAQGYEIVHIEDMAMVPSEGAILICREHVAAPEGCSVVNLLEEIARDQAILDIGIDGAPEVVAA